MVTKADLYRRIDALPDEALPLAERLLAELEEDTTAPCTPLDQAPADDEPLTPEEEQSITEAGGELDRGEGLSTMQVRQALGL